MSIIMQQILEVIILTVQGAYDLFFDPWGMVLGLAFVDLFCYIFFIKDDTNT